MAQPVGAPICIVGMSRSGTSLTARAFNLLGVDLGPDAALVSPRPQNPTGYWELQRIYEISEWVFTALGGTYERPPAFAPNWQRSPRLSALKRQALRLIDELFADSPLWGFKDPRASLILPFWREVVPQMRYVICIRHPLDAAASFAAYRSETGEASAEDWSRLWLLSTASALVDSSDSPRLVVFYDDYFSDLRQQVDRLAAFVGTAAEDESLAAIEAFVRPGLRHHRMGEEPRGAELPADVASLYAALRGLPPQPSAAQLRALDNLARRALARAGRRQRGRWSIRRPARPSVGLGRIQRFPADLDVPGVAYSGIYRDGWLALESQVTVAGGPAADLELQFEVPPREHGQRLRVIVDGELAAFESVEAGPAELIIPVSRRRRSRTIELRWDGDVPLAPPDPRRVAARLLRLEIAPRSSEPARRPLLAGGG